MTDRVFTFPVIEHEVIDGDTVRVWMDLGFRRYQGRQDDRRTWESVRIALIDTPESRTRDELEKKAGLVATQAVESWIDEGVGKGMTLMVHSIEAGKFAQRFIGDLYWAEDDQNMLSQYMLDNGWAAPYDGGTRHDWSDQELQDIIDRGRQVFPE